MNSFDPGNSFGEKCLMHGEVMKFTLITVTECELAILNTEGISLLDNGVHQLLAQVEAAGPSLAAENYTEDEIYEEYIKQESDRRWSEYRQKVITDVINFQGIMPGYGKWSKS